MEEDDTVVNRRGSLSISALLNDNSVDPVSKRKSISSSDDRSSSASPNMSAAEIAPNAGASSSNNSKAHISKAKRKRISPQQYNRLMEIFDQTDTPSSEIREKLAEELGMTKREVQVWFQNRRAKVSRAKNMVNTRNRQPSIVSPQNIRSRRLSLNAPPVGFQQPPPPPPPPHLNPIAPQLRSISTPNLPHRSYQHKPNAIDLLASAAEYVDKQ